MLLNRKIGYVIGIDPDLEKNGVACIDRNYRILHTAYLTFPETLEYVKRIYNRYSLEAGERVAKDKPAGMFDVYVEAGWLNKGNWHVTESRNGHFSPSAWAAAVGKSDGECSAVSKKLIECFKYYDIPVTPIKPLRKCWKGKDRKITHEEIKQQLATYKVEHTLGGQSNQEVRDAILLSLVNL